jgi:hypothetical protein
MRWPLKGWRTGSGMAPDVTATTSRNNGCGWSDWGSLIPQMISSSLMAAALVVIVMRVTGSASPPVVVFDVIKLANAQRALASRFLSTKGADEVAPLLMDVSKRTRAVIHKVAGANTIVVIRQAVVQGEMRDITDEVLTRLGLPTNVPTADPTRHVLEVAPTLLGVGPLSSDERRSRPPGEQSATLP